MNYKQFYFQKSEELSYFKTIINQPIILLQVQDSYELISLSSYNIAETMIELPYHDLEGKIITTIFTQKYSDKQHIDPNKVNFDMDNLPSINISIDNNEGFILIK